MGSYGSPLHMLIREQGNTVKLIRAERGRGSLRSRQEVIGSFRLEAGPAKALLALLADDERVSLERWLTARQQQQHRQTLDDALPPWPNLRPPSTRQPSCSPQPMRAPSGTNSKPLPAHSSGSATLSFRGDPPIQRAHAMRKQGDLLG